MDHDLPARFECRLYDRGLAACLNMLQILFSIRNGNGIPAPFQPGKRQQ